ncbi:leukocyte immunoglobulin-like receptor subfamily A member 5 [Monodelphis domestica]|uniref:leukocyte immunoglobulin-like receptor subfamily A member 5 n=1 Tax=Monodelphis domestica TaxID=13616 RepID=UPI0024E2412A|nr:leukocyte immunoglobulin-like receptor subfamily A member 5 [Monodelphis domestica]
MWKPFAPLQQSLLSFASAQAILVSHFDSFPDCFTEQDRLPKPSLRAENGSVVPKGGAVTLRCRGSWEAVLWLLEKRGGSGWSLIKDVRQAGNEGQVSLPSVTPHDAGTYQCLYRHSSYGWSQLSDPLELVVTGLSAPPSLAALPSSEVAEGQTVTLQCRSELYHDWCVLCKEGQEISRGRTRSHGRGRQADFFFPAVNLTQEGTYRCFGFYSSSPSLWSSPSAALLLRVSGTFSPSPESEDRLSDAAALDYTMGNLVRLTLAGLVLVLLGVLLAEHWKSSRRHPVQAVLG